MAQPEREPELDEILLEPVPLADVKYLNTMRYRDLVALVCTLRDRLMAQETRLWAVERALGLAKAAAKAQKAGQEKLL